MQNPLQLIGWLLVLAAIFVAVVYGVVLFSNQDMDVSSGLVIFAAILLPLALQVGVGIIMIRRSRNG